MNYQVTSINLSVELKKQIKKKAEKEQRTMSNTINVLLKEALEAEKRKAK